MLRHWCCFGFPSLDRVAALCYSPSQWCVFAFGLHLPLAQSSQVSFARKSVKNKEAEEFNPTRHLRNRKNLRAQRQKEQRVNQQRSIERLRRQKKRLRPFREQNQSVKNRKSQRRLRKHRSRHRAKRQNPALHQNRSGTTRPHLNRNRQRRNRAKSKPHAKPGKQQN